MAEAHAPMPGTWSDGKYIPLPPHIREENSKKYALSTQHEKDTIAADFWLSAFQSQITWFSAARGQTAQRQYFLLQMAMDFGLPWTTAGSMTDSLSKKLKAAEAFKLTKEKSGSADGGGTDVEQTWQIILALKEEAVRLSKQSSSKVAEEEQKRLHGSYLRDAAAGIMASGKLGAKGGKGPQTPLKSVQIVPPTLEDPIMVDDAEDELILASGLGMQTDGTMGLTAPIRGAIATSSKDRKTSEFFLFFFLEKNGFF